jgi:hypothetical protein
MNENLNRPEDTDFHPNSRSWHKEVDSHRKMSRFPW